MNLNFTNKNWNKVLLKRIIYHTALFNSLQFWLDNQLLACYSIDSDVLPQRVHPRCANRHNYLWLKVKWVLIYVAWLCLAYQGESADSKNFISKIHGLVEFLNHKITQYPTFSTSLVEISYKEMASTKYLVKRIIKSMLKRFKIKRIIKQKGSMTINPNKAIKMVMESSN